MRVYSSVVEQLIAAQQVGSSNLPAPFLFFSFFLASSLPGLRGNCYLSLGQKIRAF